MHEYWRDLGCNYAFICMEEAPKLSHKILAIKNGTRAIITVDGTFCVDCATHTIAFQILEGFHAGMRYFGKKPRRKIFG